MLSDDAQDSPAAAAAAAEPVLAAPEALVEAMVDGMYVVDRHRRIIRWNRAATTLTGWSREEALGRFCGDGLLNHVDEHGQSLCGQRCPLLAVMRDGEQHTVRVYAHHRDGHVVPVRVTGAPLRDPDGRIVGAVETFGLDEELVEVARRLREAEQLSLVDPSTGVGNRRRLERELETRFATRARDGLGFGVIVLDVDHFKEVNDAHGHDVGDVVLTVVARSLLSGVRAVDEVVRYGGDEFAVVTGPIGHAELAALAERLRGVVAGSTVETADGPPIVVSASIGAALVRDTDDAGALVRRADQAMLRAKRHGRDRVALAGDQHEDRPEA